MIVTFYHTFGYTFHCFVRPLSNEHVKLTKILFSHLVVISIVDINIGVNFFKTLALLVCKVLHI